MIKIDPETPETTPGDNSQLRLVSIRDTIQMLGCGRTALYKFLNEGKLEAVHVGRKTMIPLQEIKRFVALLPRYRPATDLVKSTANHLRSPQTTNVDRPPSPIFRLVDGESLEIPNVVGREDVDGEKCSPRSQNAVRPAARKT